MSIQNEVEVLGGKFTLEVEALEVREGCPRGIDRQE
jgi:hypothetical protein